MGKKVRRQKRKRSSLQCDFHSLLLKGCRQVIATHLDRCVFLKDKNTDKGKETERENNQHSQHVTQVKYSPCSFGQKSLFVFPCTVCPCRVNAEKRFYTNTSVKLADAHLYLNHWRVSDKLKHFFGFCPPLLGAMNFFFNASQTKRGRTQQEKKNMKISSCKQIKSK